MRKNFRETLRTGQVTLGGWLQIGHPACAEIHARAGFDWVCVDLEHGAIDLETTTNIFRTLQGFDCTPVARLPLNDDIWIHRVLDAGARAIIVPMINSAEEAEKVVRLAKYPPRGTRGYGFARGNMHGIDFQEHVRRDNEEIATIVMIEHKDAIARLDEILSVDGVDGAFVGPMDLSGSMGIVGQMKHPDMLAALEKYRDACKRHKVAAGIHVVYPTEANIKEATGLGYTLIALGLDVVFLAEGTRAGLRAAGRNVS